MSLDLPLVLKTKYAFHALLWLGEPEVVLDIGSMDGSDSKRFRTLVPRAEIVAFEGNPYNYQAMLSDPQIGRRGIRVENRLVSDGEGESSFFVQRPTGTGNFNRGASSMTRRDQIGATTEEVRLQSVSVESFLLREYPRASSVALWVDVEGHAHTVFGGLGSVADRVKLIHVEVETGELWSGQKLEADVLRLASSLGFVAVARGAHSLQRDVILVSHSWYAADRTRIDALLRLASWHGPALSRIIAWSNFGR
jgi:FkbM family methyltransferase